MQHRFEVRGTARLALRVRRCRNCATICPPPLSFVDDVFSSVYWRLRRGISIIVCPSVCPPLSRPPFPTFSYQAQLSKFVWGSRSRFEQHPTSPTRNEAAFFFPLLALASSPLLSRPAVLTPAHPFCLFSKVLCFVNMIVSVRMQPGTSISLSNPFRTIPPRSHEYRSSRFSPVDGHLHSLLGKQRFSV